MTCPPEHPNADLQNGEADTGAATVNTFGAIELVGNLPVKMLTLMAQAILAAGQEDRYIQYSKTSKQLDNMQGNNPVKCFRRASSVEKYMRQALSRAGLVELGTQIGLGNKPVPAARITERGLQEGVAIAGAMLSLELDSPQNAFLQRVPGMASRQPGVHNHRAMLYQKLMDGPATIAELQSPTYQNPAVLRTVKDLCALGVLEKHDRYDPVNRLFRISEPEKLSAYYTPEVRAVVAGLIQLCREGRQIVSGMDILRRASKIHPHLSLRTVKRNFFQWAGKAPDFIQEVEHLERGPRLIVSIAESYRPQIAEWLRIRELLAADSDEGRDFRQEAQGKAWDIVDTPEAVTHLLKPKTETGEPQVGGPHSGWRAVVSDLIPEEGISLRDLHQAVIKRTGKYIAYGGFRSNLRKLDHVALDYRLPPEPGVLQKPQLYASYLAGAFAADWSDRGRCNTDDVDIELFFPPSLYGPSIAQARKAKAICQTCPVRPPCLRDAIDNDVQYGIRGGIWLENCEENTPELRENIRKQVKIHPA